MSCCGTPVAGRIPARLQSIADCPLRRPGPVGASAADGCWGPRSNGASHRCCAPRLGSRKRTAHSVRTRVRTRLGALMDAVAQFEHGLTARPSARLSAMTYSSVDVRAEIEVLFSRHHAEIYAYLARMV